LNGSLFVERSFLCEAALAVLQELGFLVSSEQPRQIQPAHHCCCWFLLYQFLRMYCLAASNCAERGSISCVLHKDFIMNLDRAFKPVSMPEQ
jgi:hypothetical protein